MTKEELRNLLLEYYEYINEIGEVELLRTWGLLKRTEEFVEAHKSQLKPQEGETKLKDDSNQRKLLIAYSEYLCKEYFGRHLEPDVYDVEEFLSIEIKD